MASLLARWQAIDTATDPAAEDRQARLLQETVAALTPWLQRQPDTVWRWLPLLGRHAIDVGRVLIANLLRPDVDQALRHAALWSDVQPALSNDIYAPIVAHLVAGREFQRAMQATEAARLGDSDRAAVLQQIANSWADIDPAAAARWASAKKSAAWEPLLASICDRWINQDPRGATDFAAALPPGPPRNTLLVEALSRWLALDEDAAVAWLQGQPSAAELDAPLMRYLTSDTLVRRDAALAIRWAAKLSDEHQRGLALQGIADTLVSIDPLWGEQVLRTTDALTDPERVRLLQTLAR